MAPYSPFLKAKIPEIQGTIRVNYQTLGDSSRQSGARCLGLRKLGSKFPNFSCYSDLLGALGVFRRFRARFLCPKSL